MANPDAGAERNLGIPGTEGNNRSLTPAEAEGLKWDSARLYIGGEMPYERYKVVKREITLHNVSRSGFPNG